MKKITVTVKGEAGSGTASVAALIDRVLCAQGADVSLDAMLTADVLSFVTNGISRMDSTKVKIKRKQLPRAEKPVLAEGDTQMMEVTAKERVGLECQRGDQ